MYPFSYISGSLFWEADVKYLRRIGERLAANVLKGFLELMTACPPARLYGFTIWRGRIAARLWAAWAAMDNLGPFGYSVPGERPSQREIASGAFSQSELLEPEDLLWLAPVINTKRFNASES